MSWYFFPSLVEILTTMSNLFRNVETVRPCRCIYVFKDKNIVV